MRRNYFVIQWLDFQIIWFIIFRSNYHCYVTPYSGKVLVNTGSGHNMSPDGTEPQPDPTLTIYLRCPNMILENTWNITDKHLFSRTLSHIPEGGVLMRQFSRNSFFTGRWYFKTTIGTYEWNYPSAHICFWTRVQTFDFNLFLIHYFAL